MKRHLNVCLKLSMFALPLLLPACYAPSYRPHECYHPLVACSLPAPPPSVWQPDWVVAYSVGRTVDPLDPNLMHEAHTVYRREETSHPNLAPPFAMASPSVAPAASPSVTNINVLLRDALTAEVNQQRAASQALIEEARALDERLRELNRRSQDFRNSFEDTTRLRAQLQAVTNRLAVIESQLRTAPAAPTNRTPSQP